MKGKAEGGNELKKEEKVRGFQETILNSSCLRVTKGKCDSTVCWGRKLVLAVFLDSYILNCLVKTMLDPRDLKRIS